MPTFGKNAPDIAYVTSAPEKHNMIEGIPIDILSGGDNSIRQSLQQLRENYHGLPVRTYEVEIDGERYVVSSHFKDEESLKTVIFGLIQTMTDREFGIGK